MTESGSDTGKGASPARVLDVHVHLAGLNPPRGQVSARMRRSLVFLFMRYTLGIDPADPEAEALYASRLAALVEEAEGVDSVLALGMDGAYGEDGSMDPERSHLVVTPEWVFQVCRRHPVLLPAPSINPLRPDALPVLRWCDEQGAILIKWLAPLMLFDPGDRRVVPFFEELARLGMPLLSHTGCEHTFPGMAQPLGRPERLKQALEVGVQVIAAHCGVACPAHRAQHATAEVLDLMQRYPNLYADTAALTSPLKFQHLGHIPYGRFPGRILHGSDYPIPSLTWPYVFKLGLGETRRLAAIRNPLQRDVAVKRALGVPAGVFTAGWDLLKDRVRRWEEMKSEK